MLLIKFIQPDTMKVNLTYSTKNGKSSCLSTKKYGIYSSCKSNLIKSKLPNSSPWQFLVHQLVIQIFKFWIISRDIKNSSTSFIRKGIFFQNGFDPYDKVCMVVLSRRSILGTLTMWLTLLNDNKKKKKMILIN